MAQSQFCKRTYKMRQTSTMAKGIMKNRFAQLGINFESVTSDPFLARTEFVSHNHPNVLDAYVCIGIGFMAWVWRVEKDFYLIYFPGKQNHFMIRQGNIDIALAEIGEKFSDNACNINISMEGFVCKDENGHNALELHAYSGFYFNNPEWEIVKKTKKVDVSPQQPAGIEDIPAPAKERRAIRKKTQKTAKKKQELQNVMV